MKARKSILENKALMKKDFAGRVAEAGLKFKEFITEMYTTNKSAKEQITYAQ